VPQRDAAIPADNIRVFDEHARRYDAWYADHRAAFESELVALRSLTQPTDRSLEIGAGSGRFAAALRIGVAVEPAPAMARLARGRGLVVVAALGERLPFRDHQFDLALIVTTLCFLADPRAALAETRRVLSPTGQLLVGFLDRASPGGGMLDRRRQDSPFYAHARLHTAVEVESRVQDCGFAIERCVQTLFGDPDGLSACDEIRDGHGDGLFVAMRCRNQA
jgi:SAM-dependent methyltransferase